jgi:hypothetical protein
VWNHEANAALRQKRKSAHVLQPGDRIVLPGVQQQELSRAVDALHRIQVLRPQIELKIVLGDHHGRPFKQQPYELRLSNADTEPVRGTTDGQGQVIEKLPSHVTEVIVTLTEQQLTWRVSVSSTLPALPEAAEASGKPLSPEAVRAVQTRLNALGVPSGSVNGVALHQLRRGRNLSAGGPLAAEDLSTLEEFGA